jgi:hypothetical protein
VVVGGYLVPTYIPILLTYPNRLRKDCRDGSGNQYPSRITRIRPRFFCRFQPLISTEGKLCKYFRYHNLGEPLKKLVGAPFFLRREGIGPLFVHFALLLKKKKEFPWNFSRKEFPRKLKNVFPPKFTVQQYRP